MPDDAHLAAPKRPNTHTVAECDVVLQRRADMGRHSGRITDAWLDERLSAMVFENAKP